MVLNSLHIEATNIDFISQFKATLYTYVYNNNVQNFILFSSVVIPITMFFRESLEYSIVGIEGINFECDVYLFYDFLHIVTLFNYALKSDASSIGDIILSKSGVFIIYNCYVEITYERYILPFC